MNTDKCKECDSTSLEKCLKIQCPYFMNIKRDKNEDKDIKTESEDKEQIMKNNDNDIWINLFLFFLVTDKPETVLDLIQSDNCEEEFMDIIQSIITMDSKCFQNTCIDWLMKHRENLVELNKTYLYTKRNAKDI